MKKIKAMETKYAGCRFRSRLEARWAVFFDVMGIRWEYEKEGYKLPDGTCYLPDFWLPDFNSWFEVKGAEPTPEDQAKIYWVAKQTRIFTAVGDIPNPDSFEPESDSGISVSMPYKDGENGTCGDIWYAWCLCPVCGKVGIQYAGRGARVCGGRIHTELEGDDKSYTYDAPRITSAYRLARSARFGT